MCVTKVYDAGRVAAASVLYGDVWVWMAVAPECWLVLACVVGTRVQEHAHVLMERLKVVSCGSMTFVSSDALPHYPNAPLHGYGIPESLIQTPGKRGRMLPPTLSGELVLCQFLILGW